MLAHYEKKKKKPKGKPEYEEMELESGGLHPMTDVGVVPVVRYLSEMMNPHLPHPHHYHGSQSKQTKAVET